MNKCEEIIAFILYGVFIAFWVAVMLAAYKDTRRNKK